LPHDGGDLIDEDSPHGLGGRGKEMSSTVSGRAFSR
jgi:hypothetical protein